MTKKLIYFIVFIFLLVSCNENTEAISNLKEAVILCEKDIAIKQNEIENEINPTIENMKNELEMSKQKFEEVQDFQIGRTEEEKLNEINTLTNEIGKLQSKLNDFEIKKSKLIKEIEDLNEGISEHKIKILNLEK